MRYAIAAVATFVVLIGTEFFWRTLWRPIDQPVAEQLRLVEHFRISGFEVTDVQPIRHGFRHSYVAAVLGLRLDRHQLPVAIVACSDASAAELNKLRDPNPNLARTNGRLQLSLVMWSDDALAQRVIDVFERFR